MNILEKKEYIERIKKLNNNYYDEIRKMADNLSEKRKVHILGCIDYGVNLAKKNGVNEEKTLLACLFHDYFREYTDVQLIKVASECNFHIKRQFFKKMGVLHGPICASYLHYNKIIIDDDILNAISTHTLGGKKLGKIAKILFIADALEESRSYERADNLREKVKNLELDDAFKVIIIDTIQSTIIKRRYLFKDTINCYNEAIGGINGNS